ncbi:hypothetical protein [Microbacterium yannicii]|uniref:hypothetical protein n=1 Tax=Microbacterium yannicii TaxID=671622 RepID=UPI000372D132|nr:hypothetical protein [Microbacterium yannicii]
MPESPPEDPFADLYGKLPDPRSRQLGRTAPDSGDTGGSTPPAPVTNGGAPLSRRAAREAAARGGTGQTPTQPESSKTPTTDAAPGEGFQPVPMRSPRPTREVDGESTPIDDPWSFAVSGEAPGAALQPHRRECRRTGERRSGP